MKIKSWPLMLTCAVIFTIATIYWYITHTYDTIGIAIFALAAVLSFVGGIGNLISKR